jgi:hypothetical protein
MQPWFIAAALTLGISPVLAQQQHTMVTLNQDEVTWKGCAARAAERGRDVRSLR